MSRLKRIREDVAEGFLSLQDEIWLLETVDLFKVALPHQMHRNHDLKVASCDGCKWAVEALARLEEPDA